jgi:hypothetical protein
MEVPAVHGFFMHRMIDRASSSQTPEKSGTSGKSLPDIASRVSVGERR